MTVLVSVVVPTYHRPEALNRCLEALLAQDFNPASYEIIVVDDAASPATRQQVEELASQSTAYPFQPAIKLMSSVGEYLFVEKSIPEQQPLESVSSSPAVHYLVTQGTRGPAAARNIGWRSALGEIIAFTDDDTIPDFGWLLNGVGSFCQDVAGVTGRVLVPMPNEPHDNEWDMLGLSRSLFITANCFYRRRALEEAGGFDERFTSAWREDSDLFFTMLERGCLLVEAPLSIVVHPVRQAQWGASLKAQKKSQFNALLYKKHPVLYRKYIQSAPPGKYYAILIALIGSIIALAFGWVLLSELFLAIWLGITLAFAYQRLKHTSHRLSHLTEMVITSVFIPPLSVFWRLYGAVKYKVWFL